MSAPAFSSRRPRRSATNDVDALYLAAADAFARADDDTCRELLAILQITRADDWRADLLIARCARAGADASVTYRAARAAYRLRVTPPAARLTILALLATSAQTLGKNAEYGRFSRECELALAEANAAQACEAIAVLAGAAVAADDVASARRWLAIAGETTPHARLEALAGAIAMRRESYARAGTHFSRAIVLEQSSDRPDLRSLVDALAGAANVALETANLRSARKLRRIAAAIAWTPSLRTAQFEVLTAFRGIALLEGDLEEAWVLSRTALATAPSDAYEAIGELNGAIATRLLGDERTSEVQMVRAWDALRREPGPLVGRYGCMALATFASEAARSMPAEARKALTMYRSFARAAANDDALRAAGWIASARIAEAMDDRAAAIHAYREALELYEARGMSLRAALAGLDLRRLTGEIGYAKSAQVIKLRAPNAWFEARLRADKTPLRHLRPAQRQILARLLRGESAKMIASDLARSTFTVSNHTRKIFSAFNVHSRDALRAKCTNFGITEESLRRDL